MTINRNQLFESVRLVLIVFTASSFFFNSSAWSQSTTEQPARQAAAEEGTSEKAKAGKKQDSVVDDFRHFLRISKDGKGKSLGMDTSVTRYVGVNADGVPFTVDLIGVVHVGEQGYYEKLNDLFRQYDGMLYELVAPEGTRIPSGGRSEMDSMNPVAALQLGMKSVLGLEFQLDHVDYMADNFVHADMTPEEFAESMANNDESVMKIFLKAVGQSMAMQSSSSTTDAELLMAMFSKKPERVIRKVMAEQMQNMEASMSIFKGKNGSTIIDHRNAKAMSVLDREIKSGKTKLALFYGAGHLPDMQRRLMEDFGMKRGGQFWLRAWEFGDE